MILAFAQPSRAANSSIRQVSQSVSQSVSPCEAQQKKQRSRRDSSQAGECADQLYQIGMRCTERMRHTERQRIAEGGVSGSE